MRFGPLALVLIAAAAFVGSCRDWDMYDPRLGATDVGGGISAGGAAGEGGVAGGAAGMGGGGAGGTGGQEPCGTTDMLGDDFGDGTLSTALGSYAENCTVSETGGALVVAFDGTDDAGATVWTDVAYDMRGRALSIELTELPPGLDHSFSFYLNLADDYLSFQLSDDTLYFSATLGGNQMSLASVLFDPLDHRFYRYRADPTTVYLETSGDGVTWDEHADLLLADLGHTLQYVWTELDVDSDEPGEVHFDNLVGGVPSAEGWCPSGNLQDDFESGPFSDAWQSTSFEDECAIDVDGGEVRLTVDAGFNVECARGTSTRYDMTDAAVTLEVVSPPPVAEDAYVDWYVGEDSENYALFELYQGDLLVQREDDSNFFDVDSVPFDPQAHRFLRLRDGEGQMHWEASPDGANWSAIASVQQFMDPTRVAAAFSVGAYAPPVDIESRVDNFNVVP